MGKTLRNGIIYSLTVPPHETLTTERQEQLGNAVPLTGTATPQLEARHTEVLRNMFATFLYA